MNETYWITGGSGLVGGSLRASLAAHSPESTVLAPSSSEVDLRDPGAVASFLERAQPTVVIHAAGIVGGIAANVRNPCAFLRDNMLIGMNVIDGSRNAGVARLINIGSSCMYPKDRELLREDDVLTGALEPTNEGYALAKIAADRLCAYVSTETGLAYRTVIPSNLYGPGDHFDEGRGHLVASAIRKIHRAAVLGAPTVQIWGDGTARREFTYVRDVTDWIAQVAAGAEALPQRLNIGIGEDHTVTEYYEAIAEAVGYTGDFEHDVSKPAGMQRKLMDSSLAAGHGWRAPTSLESGLQKTLAYYRENASDE